jgi:hypothetical protein
MLGGTQLLQMSMNRIEKTKNRIRIIVSLNYSPPGTSIFLERGAETSLSDGHWLIVIRSGFQVSPEKYKGRTICCQPAQSDAKDYLEQY